MWTKTAMVIRPCNCYLQRWYLLAGELPTTALWCSPSVPSCEAAHLSWVGFVIVGILVINIMISAFFTIIIIGLFCKYSGSWALVGLLRSGQFSRTFCFLPDNSTRPIWCKKDGLIGRFFSLQIIHYLGRCLACCKADSSVQQFVFPTISIILGSSVANKTVLLDVFVCKWSQPLRYCGLLQKRTWSTS